MPAALVVGARDDIFYADCFAPLYIPDGTTCLSRRSVLCLRYGAHQRPCRTITTIVAVMCRKCLTPCVRAAIDASGIAEASLRALEHDHPSKAASSMEEEHCSGCSVPPIARWAACHGAFSSDTNHRNFGAVLARARRGRTLRVVCAPLPLLDRHLPRTLAGDLPLDRRDLIPSCMAGTIAAFSPAILRQGSSRLPLSLLSFRP
jgi:hypothetical protein